MATKKKTTKASPKNEPTEKAPEPEVGAEPNGSDGDGEAAKKSKPRGKISFEHIMARDEAVAYFQAIVAGMKKGSMTFEQGDDQLELAVSEQVAVEVKASVKGSKQKVSFEIAWRTDEPELEIS